MIQQEKAGKRQNVDRWRSNRARRLEYEEKRGRATPRQIARLNQLRESLKGI